jgi:HK97 family phage major capsid protein
VNTPNAQPGIAAGRLIKSLLQAHGDAVGALAYAEGQRLTWAGTPETRVALKTAVDALTTSNAGGLAGAIPATSDFVALVREVTLLDRVVDFRRVPLNVTIAATATDANAHLVGEGVAKPLSRFSTELLTVEPRKCAASVVVTRDVLRMSSGVADLMLATELARAVGAVVDRAFLDPDTAGSIANGATVLNSSGGTLAQIDADLQTMLKALGPTGALATAVWAMPSQVAVALASVRGTGGAAAYPVITARGGTLLGLPVVTTGALTATGSPGEYAISLFDPQQILLGDEGQIGISVARHASVQLDDAPSTPATQTVSLFQSGLAAPRAERWIGWERVSTASVVTLDNVQWA